MTKTRPVNPLSPVQPTTIKCQGFVIELHSGDAYGRIFREIIRMLGRAPMLAAAETLDEPITASPYFGVLAATFEPNPRQDAIAKGTPREPCPLRRIREMEPCSSWIPTVEIWR